MDQTWARQSLRIPYSLKPFLQNAPNRSEAIIEALKAYYGVDGGGGQEYLFQRIAAIEVHLGIEPPPAPEPPPIEVPPAKPKKKRKAKAKKSPPPPPPAEVEENPPGVSRGDTVTATSTPLDGQDLPAPAEDTPGEEPDRDEIPPPAEVEEPDSDTTKKLDIDVQILTNLRPSPAPEKTGQIKWDIFLQDFPDKTIANLEELTTIACERYPDRKVNSLRESLRTKLKKLAKRK